MVRLDQSLQPLGQHVRVDLRGRDIGMPQQELRMPTAAILPLGRYQGVTEQVRMSRTPGLFKTVLVPRRSSKAEWLES